MGALAGASEMKRILVDIVGWSFIVLGIAGLFLPFLQGILFILIGIVILSSRYGWARLLLMKVRKRFPRLGQTVEVARKKAREWMKGFDEKEAD